VRRTHARAPERLGGGLRPDADADGDGDGAAMSGRFEIQARLLRGRDGVVVRDESRLACAEALDDGLRAANAWVTEGFIVWIYRVTSGDGVRPVYRTVRTLSPGR
jgi:hypothetical protein